MKAIFFVFMVSCGMAFIAHAYNLRQHSYQITNEKAISAIVGEYAVNDEYGMRAYAHAIRNRGTLKGVYGINAKHNKKEPGYIWELASLAWFESKLEPDMVYGADSWLSNYDISHGSSLEGKDIRYIYKGTYFYKSTQNKRR